MSTATASPQQPANAQSTDAPRQDDARKQPARGERTPNSERARTLANGYWILAMFLGLFFAFGAIGLVMTSAPMDLKASKNGLVFYRLDQSGRSSTLISCYQSLKAQPVHVRAMFSIDGKRPRRRTDAPSPTEDARVLFTLRPQGGSDAETLTYETTWDITRAANGAQRASFGSTFTWQPQIPASFQGRPLVATARVFHSGDSNHANDSASEIILNPC